MIDTTDRAPRRPADRRICASGSSTRPGTIPAFVALISEAHLADGIDWLPTVEAVRSDHEHHAEFDPRRDVVARRDRRAASSPRPTTDVRTRDGRRQPPGRRLGPAGLAPARSRPGARSAGPRHGPPRSRRVDGRPPERVLSAWPDEGQVGALALYECAGYRIVRYGFMMVRDLAEPIPDRPMPAGLEVRPVVEADHRRIWDADVEAFRDHWNPGERTEADFAALFASPELDTTLWQVAWDGDEVAGSILTAIFPGRERDARRCAGAGSSTFSVRRPWRRRGLASALIAAIASGCSATGHRRRPRSASTPRTCRGRSGSTSRWASARHRTRGRYRKDFTAG